MTEILTNYSEGQTLQKAAEVLMSGGIVFIPTDTVYGIAAGYDNAAAIRQLFRIKERDAHKSIATLLADSDQVPLLAQSVPASAQILAEKFWPGGLTLLYPKKAGLPAELSDNDKIGLRIPDLTFTRALIRLTGPLATTSANFSGQPPALEISEIPPELLNQVPLAVDCGRVKQGKASTVVDCTVDPVTILREGALSSAEIFTELGRPAGRSNPALLV